MLMMLVGAVAVEPPELARQLDRALVGLGAAVGEERAHAAADVVELLGQLHLPLVDVEVRDMDEPLRLVMIARTTAGCTWPRTLVAMPATRSRYSVPFDDTLITTVPETFSFSFRSAALIP